MDTPIALAIIAIYVASIVSMLRGNGEIYFDSVSMFVFFMLLGRFIEMRTRHRAGDVVDALVRLQPALADRRNGDGYETVGVHELEIGDRVRVASGGAFPADGVLASAHCRVDESLLTGESTPRLRVAGDAVIAGSIANAFCATRPPGHHARPGEPMGFCLFNNVAIAARHAMDAHGLARVAIIDFDVHHGNGTAESFRDDRRVLMCSFFQHPFYPYTDPEPFTANCVNVPVPARSKGDVVRQLVLDHWLPALHAFKPEMIFISAGFDAHREDDLGQMGLVEADYAWITEQVVQAAHKHAKGRIVSCLEGGYNLSALGRSVVAHLKALAEID
jgi:hypothetical protein